MTRDDAVFVNTLRGYLGLDPLPVQGAPAGRWDTEDEVRFADWLPVPAPRGGVSRASLVGQARGPVHDGPVKKFDWNWRRADRA